MKVIAKIHTEFPTKFGIPRQSGIIESLRGSIVFEPDYRNPDAVRGLEDFSHLWLIWEFSEAKRDTWSPTVRPPRLGGNTRKGVFATRSPFRPNPIGLSSVKLEKIEIDPKLGPVLYVTGIDLMDGTPIYDIKPYIAYTDSHPDAISGFASKPAEYLLEVDCPETLLQHVDAPLRDSLVAVLAHDPRPQYQDDPNRVYGMEFGPYEVRFKVNDLNLTVLEIKNTTDSI
jgi:tRNA-Thr(GGU) m(6)t(6)A37 methyltransferase TsaA